MDQIPPRLIDRLSSLATQDPVYVEDELWSPDALTNPDYRDELECLKRQLTK